MLDQAKQQILGRVRRLTVWRRAGERAPPSTRLVWGLDLLAWPQCGCCDFRLQSSGSTGGEWVHRFNCALGNGCDERRGRDPRFRASRPSVSCEVV